MCPYMISKMAKDNQQYFPLALFSLCVTCIGNFHRSHTTVQAMKVPYFQLTVLIWMPHCRSDQRSRQARNSNAFKLLVLLVILDNGPLILDGVFSHVSHLFKYILSHLVHQTTLTHYSILTVLGI